MYDSNSFFFSPSRLLIIIVLDRSETPPLGLLHAHSVTRPVTITEQDTEVLTLKPWKTHPHPVCGFLSTKCVPNTHTHTNTQTHTHTHTQKGVFSLVLNKSDIWSSFNFHRWRMTVKYVIVRVLRWSHYADHGSPEYVEVCALWHWAEHIPPPRPNSPIP